MNKKIAIIGNGWVGRAMLQLFPDAYVYHPNRKNKKEVEKARELANECDIAFICVPTPCPDEGRLDTSIVGETIAWLKTPLIVVRSTVNPGDCYRWQLTYKKRILMQPEYLGETINHPLTNQQNTTFLIIGGDLENRTELIELYTTVYNANIRIRQVTAYAAEVIKISENRAIAFKVAQCQELYDACKAAEIDYYSVRDAVYGDDPRFDLWWTFIYPNQRGFNSKCIPKDVYAWAAWAEGVGIEPKITRAIVEKNKEWIK